MATGETKKKLGNEVKRPSSKANSEYTYSISYDGKKEVEDILNTSPANVTEVWSGDSATEKDPRGSLYYGENLPIISHLVESGLKGKVKLIYIDPPYATNQVFVSKNRKGGYEDLLTGAHFLEFMRERLILLKELLAPDGSIYVHLDDNMAFEIKLLMDEIFGKKNFHNFIVRKKSNPKNYTRKQFGNVADYVLFYSKGANYTWNRPYDKWLPESAEKEYSYIEKETGRRFKKVPVHAPGTRNGDTGKPWKGLMPPEGKHWQYKRETLDALDNNGLIYWSATGNPRRKIYLDENLGIPIQDIWMDMKDAHNQNIKITGYPTEKNPDLLKRIIEASSNEDDLVLDCFAGSGTTMGAAADLSRRWIGIDSSPEAINSTLTRFLHGLKPMGDYTKNQPQTSMLPDFIGNKYLAGMKFYSESSRIKEKELQKQIDALNTFNAGLLK